MKLKITPVNGPPCHCKQSTPPPTTTPTAAEPTKFTLNVNSATSTVNLKTGAQTNSGTYAYGNYNVIPTQTQPGAALDVSANVDAPLPNGWKIVLTWTAASTPICETTTEKMCGGTLSYPAGAVNVTITADIVDPKGSIGASVIAAANPNCTDGKTASQDGGTCPGSR